MIKETVTDVEGREITLMIPENQADVERLREMEQDGELDTDESFADSPSSLPIEDQGPKDDAPRRGIDPPFEEPQQ